jgi:hypothetical protein
LTAATDFMIPYIEWGLNNPSTFVLKVSDKVQMHIEAAALGFRLQRDGRGAGFSLRRALAPLRARLPQFLQISPNPRL